MIRLRVLLSPLRLNRVRIKISLKIQESIKFSTILTFFMNINSYLMSRITFLYSLFCLIALGKAKNLQVLHTDEWPRVDFNLFCLF